MPVPPTAINTSVIVTKASFTAKNLPNGVQDLGGSLLSDDNYGVSRFLKGNKYMLWLEKIVERDEADGVPVWEVKDVLVFKNLKKIASFSIPTTRRALRTAKKIRI